MDERNLDKPENRFRPTIKIPENYMRISTGMVRYMILSQGLSKSLD